VTFIGHPEIGARMFEKIARRLPFPFPMTDRLRFLIAAHLRAAAYDDQWTDSAVRRFARDADDALDDLLDLARADITSKYEDKVRRGLRQINLLADRIEKLKTEDERPPALPAGLGHAIMQQLNIAPGPGLGRLMSHLKAKVGEIPACSEFAVYLNYIHAHHLA
jgi:poly(A) polymerase